jgi:uncharacterized protein
VSAKGDTRRRPPPRRDALERAAPREGCRSTAFLLGLVVAGVALGGRVGGGAAAAAPAPALLVAGLLVGFGARVGGGCTSGHGVCGISRWSVRSLVATTTFIATGAATVFVVTHLLPTLAVPR